MMGLFSFSKANCKDCYRCLRTCPVKAILIKDDQANIIESRCIDCGFCLYSCPQDAGGIKSDLMQVKEAIEKGRTVIASLAPSFAGAFDMEDPGQMVTALKRLGISIVEETAIGADIVTALYKRHLAEGKSTNLITTCCPSANYLIEKYHPSLIPYMIPVASPMLAHGRLLKHIHGEGSYVVFIGPCVAKKAEALDQQYLGTIDAVLTFNELSKWLFDKSIDLKQLVPSAFDRSPSINGRQYPITGGVVESLTSGGLEHKYELIKVNGISKCSELFHAIEMGLIENICAEVNICEGGCIGGPGMPDGSRNYFKYYRQLKEFARKYKAAEHFDTAAPLASLDFSRNFHENAVHTSFPSEKELTKVLAMMGKFTHADELNCTACGYNSCREKARAVIDGMAEMSMCLPFMRNKAESLTNVIFDQSPNIIMLIDKDLKVKEFNPTSARLLKISAQEAKGKPIGLLMDDSCFASVIKTKQNIYKQKIELSQYGLVFMTNLVYLEKQNLILAIMTDITMDEKHQQELTRVKQNTLDAAQEVITRQMRVAQEIAGLLGETTAETKVLLTRLKELVIGEVGDTE